MQIDDAAQRKLDFLPPKQACCQLVVMIGCDAGVVVGGGGG